MPQKKTGRQGIYLKLYKTSICRQNSKNQKGYTNKKKNSANWDQADLPSSTSSEIPHDQSQLCIFFNF